MDTRVCKSSKYGFVDDVINCGKKRGGFTKQHGQGIKPWPSIIWKSMHKKQN